MFKLNDPSGMIFILIAHPLRRRGRSSGPFRGLGFFATPFVRLVPFRTLLVAVDDAAHVTSYHLCAVFDDVADVASSVDDSEH